MKLFTIGCSFTEGQGLENHKVECYTHLLAQNINLKYFNFGASGASNDYIFRKVFELINSNTLQKDDILIIQWTHFNRRELPIRHNKRNWYHYIPNSYHIYDDKKILNKNNDISVWGEYRDENTHEDKIYIELKNKEILEKFILNFLNNDYQLNTTKNYIDSLYAYLSHYGYKHLHFFGWNDCLIDSIIYNKDNFLEQTFGRYTNTEGNSHPNKEGHKIWADFLSEKIKEKNLI